MISLRPGILDDGVFLMIDNYELHTSTYYERCQACKRQVHPDGYVRAFQGLYLGGARGGRAHHGGWTLG
jgi:hypothetical protein